MDYKEEASGLNDTDRKNATHIMMGVVVHVDPSTAKATVNIHGKEIPGLSIMAQRAGANGKFCWLPAVGEQVVLLSPFGNLTQAIIAGSIYYGESDNEKKTDLPTDLNPLLKKTYYPDGTTTSYDATKHELLIALKEEKIKICAYAENAEKESGLEFSLGDCLFIIKQKDEKISIKLKKAEATIHIDDADNIYIRTNKNIELSADEIILNANKVDVKKK